MGNITRSVEMNNLALPKVHIYEDFNYLAAEMRIPRAFLLNHKPSYYTTRYKCKRF